jgi:triosephosphate isomerase
MTHDRPRPLVAGNWKMNGLQGSARVLAELRDGYTPDLKAAVDLLVCPPATLIQSFALAAIGSRIAIGGQDIHAEASGAFTGNVSAEMLADLGATHAIVGHSERRTYHRENDDEIRAKAEAAFRAGLTAIICVGETRDEREGGGALDVVREQLRGSVPSGANGFNTVIAYEPVWAIGTGLTPTADDVAEMHRAIRDSLGERLGEAGQAVRILYGGSVKPGNAKELLAVDNVDGALVGGASLVSADFLGIAKAYLG